MKNKPKNIPTYYNSKGTPIYRDTTALPFDNGGNMQNPPIISSFLPPTYPFNYNYNFLNPNYKVISENPNAGTESMWNPMNWLVPKMDQEVTFNDAFEKAKRAGYSEFIYNGQRYNTKSDMTPDQQMKVYGITDDRRTLDPSQTRKNLSILNTEEGYSAGAQAAISRMLGISPGLNFGINEGKAPGAKEQDAFKLYLGLPQSYNTFQPSKYKKGALALTGYNALLPDTMPSDEDIKKYGVPNYSSTWKKGNPLKPYNDFVMGRHTVQKGKDSKGEYIEYIDKWDLDTFGKTGEFADYLNKPFDIYGRKYYKDYGDGVKRTMYYSDQELQSFNPKNKNFDTLALQKELANRGYKFPKSTTKSGEFDGIYGEETKKALQDWQSKNFKPGEIYTFSGRPGSYYKYTEEGNMLIKNKNTSGKYIPMTDEEGKRLKTLQAGLVTGKTKKFLDGGPLVDKTNYGNLLPSTYASVMGNMFKEGGPFGEDKGMFDYASSVYASQPGNYYASGGYIVRRSNDRKGKTHVVIGPDGTKKYFGDPKMGERSKSKHGKEAFYARHAKNLKNNPYFRAYARATWEMGGQMNSYKDGGKFLTAGGEYHKIYKNADGDIIVNHPAEDKGKWDTINLTDKANATTVAQGVAATKKWHAENPNQYAQGGLIKRADGSYSPRGLWDNIRANKGSGKKPTKEMLAQEKKIRAAEKQFGGYLYKDGGQFSRPYSLPEDSFKQGGNNLHNSVYASSMAQYPAVYKYGGSFQMPRQQMYMPLDNVERYGGNMYREGGSVFYATNTPQLEGEGKDLTYPENAYIYASGGLINNYKAGGAMNFKSKGAYQKWLAYGHASGEFAKTPGNQPVSIGGKAHKVEHGMGGNLYAAGGGIHINPANKGKFTAKANAAGMGVQEFASKVLSAKEGSYSPETRRQANFAKNAAGWQHELGGPINPIQSHYSIPDTPMSQYGGEGHLAGTMYSYPTALPHAYGGHMYAAGGSFNNPGFKALPVEIQNKIKANSFAEGGTMDQLTEFNAGGTHEENPLGGIPQGMSPDGRMNLVEEGETKLKETAEGGGNFVYSDSIKVDRQFAEEFSLPNTYIGKTYAEASKLANRPKSRRENDTIEQTDIKRKLDSLAQAQEAQKAKEQQEQTAQELAANPQLLDALMGQLAANQSVQPMGMPQGEEVSPEEVPAEMLAQMPEAQQGMPIMRMGGNMYRCGGKMYDFGGWMDDNSATMAGAGTGALSGASTGAMLGAATGPLAVIGAPAGAIIGGLIGGVAGGLSGRKKDKAEQEAEDAARQQQLAQGTQMQQIQNPAYVTPAAQYTLNAASGAGTTYPYMAKQGGPLYHQYPQLTDRWKNNAGPMGQPLEVLYANGGSINTFNPSLMPATQTDFTRKLVGGGPGKGGPDKDFDTYLTNLQNKYKDLITYFSKSDNVLEGQTEEELEGQTEEDLALDKLTLEELSRKKESGETLTEEELAEYESVLKRLNEQLDAQNLDYSIKVKPFEAAAMALPAAYNIGTGLFGKVQQLKPEDYMIKGELSPYQYNITPELRNIQYSEASAKDAIRNAGLSGGAYASNMQNIYNTAAKLKSEALTKKQNLDAQNYMAAQQANMALQQQNMASKMGIVDWNTRAQNAKRMALQEGLKQAADIGKGFVDMRGQQALVKAVAPDYAETLKLILAKKNKPETSTETE